MGGFFSVKVTVQVYACRIHRQYSHKAGDVQFSSGNRMLFVYLACHMFLDGMYLHVGIYSMVTVIGGFASMKRKPKN